MKLPPETNETLPAVRPGTPGRPDKPRYRAQFGVIIVCPDEIAQQALYGALLALKDCKLKVVCT